MSNYYYGQEQGQNQNPRQKSSQKRSQNVQMPDKGYSSHFKPLTGRVVTVYRGGPESKTGYLVDVQSDYLILAVESNNNNNGENNNQNNQKNQNNQNNQNNNQQEYTLVYYNLAHVKSITEDTMSNSAQTFTGFNEELELYRGKTFATTLSLMKTKYVQVNQGGPEKKAGQLLDVLGSFESAYIVLLTEDDGVIYINTEHVKSVSEYQNNNGDQANQSANELLVSQEPEYMKSKSFNDLFAHLSHKWVSINNGGPEAVEGVLVQSRNGTFTLVQNNQVLRLQPRHVKTICVGAKGAFKQNDNNQNNNEETEENGETEAAKSTEERTGERTGSRTGGRTGRRTGGRTGDRSRGRRTGGRTGSRSSTPAEKVIKTKNYRWKA
ncbi:spore coat protein [Priestia sp. Y58]|nr:MULTISPECIES: spore coat protein [Priestia]MBX9986477.1 spore coat protein [Priestia aryabhattai]MBY0002523.1 spore coat protein [Priestia aryabhattai]MDG0030920.1 spore coat protein [Priestia sp. Y58]MDG0061145.1 spore coat protein [Priestia sp. P5]UYV54376.1 spore coat protein [Priestia megaterium]